MLADAPITDLVSTFLDQIEPSVPVVLDPVMVATSGDRLLSVEADQEAPGVSVRIGSENPVTGLQGTSLVTSGYGAGDEHVGAVGVLGPTRMDYPQTMANVRAVARYVSELLEQ